MEKFVLVCVLSVAPSAATSAFDGCAGPWATTAAFPSANPPGWYTNTYWFAWYYPWYANYNFSHGPYANWMAGQGHATYGNNRQHLAPASALPAEVTISLPAEATLSFSGKVAAGTGAIRMFTTPPLETGIDYAYEMTVEVKKDGHALSATKLVLVHPGEKVGVKFEPAEFKEVPAKK